jgi:hypothetical protein
LAFPESVTKRRDERAPLSRPPGPDFVTVHEDGETGNIRLARDFFAAARSGKLPAVSWVIPNSHYGEHPPGLVSDGQFWVTSVVNAIMRGPNWKSTAIFSPGTTGAVTTTTSSRRSSTRTGTACGSPGW